MKIQTRQSLYSSIAFGIIFIIISLFIYTLYSRNAQKAIYKNLEKTAYIVAFFHLEEDELNDKEFETVRKQFNEIVSGIEYQVYDVDNRIVWGKKEKQLSNNMLEKIEKSKQLNYSTETDFCYGIFYEDNQGDFVIVVNEPKVVLNEQLFSLFWILLSALVIGFLAVILLSRWLAHIAYKPFNRVIEQVKNISPSIPYNQIDLPNTKDELQELTETFNHLLEQISDTFVIQKNFVNYVSHEFKTPLASILGNLEVFSLRDRTPEEYTELSEKLISQIHQLEEILNTLMVVSNLRKNDNFNSQFRVDELIWEIIEKISVNYANAKINVQIDIVAEDEYLLTINKDRTQLLMAFLNIIENAVKYSKGEIVEIRLYKESKKLTLSIQDKGIGIPSEALKDISKPFYRATNANQTLGCGIGLSIALRILDKNNIKYEILSGDTGGTKVIIVL